MKKAMLFIVSFGILFFGGCVETPKVTLQVTGDNTVKVGESILLSISVSNSDEKVQLENSDLNILTAVLLEDTKCNVTGVGEGIGKLIFTVEEERVEFLITVTKADDPIIDPIDEDLEFVNEIIGKMSLEDKIGQMFMVGFSGMTIPATVSDNIDACKFGNYIYMDYNTKTVEGTIALTQALQNKIVGMTGIPALISIDQEGGNVAKFLSGGTHFPGNMAIAATNNPNYSYEIGKAVGTELRNFGMNVDFAPVLDVNNNPANPIIGVRSYSDNPVTVSQFGSNMIKGLQEAKVMAVAKHFPGHGDTGIDTHYDLPSIPHSLERLYEIELFPYLNAIENGLDAIMTTHIIFEALDTEYPATLSQKVLTGLLREEMGFQGLIITDGMNMKAIKDNFGYREAGVLAVLAGVDILLFTEATTDSVIAYQGVLEAVNSGRIPEEKIDESLRRILLAKKKYGLFDSYLPKEDALSFDQSSHQTLSKSLSQKSLTKVRGNLTLDSSKSILIISPRSTRYTLSPGLTGNNNSFAYLANKVLKEEGFSDISYRVLPSSYQLSEYTSIADDYDQIVIAFDNQTSASLAEQISKINPNTIAISLNKPYDILVCENANTVLCVYEYTPLSVNTIIRYLNKEFTATGILPVVINDE